MFDVLVATKFRLKYIRFMILSQVRTDTVYVRFSYSFNLPCKTFLQKQAKFPRTVLIHVKLKIKALILLPFTKRKA